MKTMVICVSTCFWRAEVQSPHLAPAHAIDHDVCEGRTSPLPSANREGMKLDVSEP